MTNQETTPDLFAEVLGMMRGFEPSGRPNLAFHVLETASSSNAIKARILTSSHSFLLHRLIIRSAAAFRRNPCNVAVGVDLSPFFHPAMSRVPG